MSKQKATKEIGMSYAYAMTLTRDLPSKGGGNRNLSESSAKLLRKMLKDGKLCTESGGSYIVLDGHDVHQRLLSR